METPGSGNNKSEVDDLESDADVSSIGIQAKFIEQEHRLVRIVLNFLERGKYPDGDPRGPAARRAFVWRIFSPGTAAVVGGGAVAIGSLIVLAIQTALIAEQNRYFQQQNSAIQAQIDQQSRQESSRRRTEVIANLYELDESDDPRYDPRTRIEAVREYVELERNHLLTTGDEGASLPRVSLSQVDLEGLNLARHDFRSVELVGADLQQSDFNGANLAGADLRASLFLLTNFRGADLTEVNCEGCNLEQSQFADAVLAEAVLTSASVKGVTFFRADLRGADLTGLRDVPTAEWAHCNIAGVVGLEAESRALALEAGAVELDADVEWRTYLETVRGAEVE
ncbi:MAG: pentapeptide repeat-containing protein [Planctomycetota bacterium]